MKKTNKKTDVSEFYPVIISELENIDSDCAKTLDLTNVFDVYTDTIFYDLIHVVDFGNKIVADRIYEEIIPILNEDIHAWLKIFDLLKADNQFESLVILI